jgi:hypothetical protein
MAHAARTDCALVAFPLLLLQLFFPCLVFLDRVRLCAVALDVLATLAQVALVEKALGLGEFPRVARAAALCIIALLGLL